ncbi:cytochrome b [Ferrovum sp. PN-J185]|uniref:cytochrome b n=1 Tax=Ferrovum sp. PN-J185 TaxID=1356306 RepID=UPI001E503CDF|nr:cytochrome b [Ferrovum sp. PN-J185]MCC6067723.1 cytochrome b [Ferrovum sp. PN-J185]MDE1891351.1 cytochrome b [Betaproteobacteria bacterium]MDE2056123.1 cytochrome b [Betaproteobacteria bacterium]
MIQKYTKTAISLHWLIALLILCAFPLGLYMSDLELSPLKLKLYAYHKWIGISVLGLFVIRLIWRVTHQPPELPNQFKAWEKKLSHIVHGLIYLLLLLIPLTGWLHSSAAGVSVVYLNLIHLPDLVTKNKELSNILKELHETLNWILVSLVALHVLGALKHQIQDRVNMLSRMKF